MTTTMKRAVFGGGCLLGSLLAAIAACADDYGSDTPGGGAAVDSGAIESSAPTLDGGGGEAGQGCGQDPIVHFEFDENTGTVTRSDTVIGELKGSVDWIAGFRGSALDFENGYVSAGDNGKVTTALTVAAWIRMSVAPGTDLNSTPAYVVGRSIANSHSNGWRLGVAGEGKATFSVFGPLASGATNPIILTGGTVATLNTWVHIAGTYDASGMRLYVNGLEDTNANPNVPLSISDTATELRIGARVDAKHDFAGAIDDVRIYCRVLSRDEITALMNVQ